MSNIEKPLTHIRVVNSVKGERLNVKKEAAAAAAASEMIIPMVIPMIKSFVNNRLNM